MARKVDREVMVGFIEEAKSYLPAIAEGIEAFRQDSTRLDGLEVAHRHTHTIKGKQLHISSADMVTIVTVINMAEKRKSCTISSFLFSFSITLGQVWIIVNLHIESISLLYFRDVFRCMS